MKNLFVFAIAFLMILIIGHGCSTQTDKKLGPNEGSGDAVPDDDDDSGDDDDDSGDDDDDSGDDDDDSGDDDDDATLPLRCQIKVSTNNIREGESVDLTLVIKGAATSATIGETTVDPTTGGPITVTPEKSARYSGEVSGPDGTFSCTSTLVSVVPLDISKDDFYSARIGPTSQSVDDLLVKGCYGCHYALGGDSDFIIKPADPDANLANLKTRELDGTKDKTLRQYYNAHNGCCEQIKDEERDHIEAWVTMP